MTFTTLSSPVNRIRTMLIQESETAIDAMATVSMAASTPDMRSVETAIEAMVGEAITIPITVRGSKREAAMNNFDTILFSSSTRPGFTNFHKLKHKNGCAHVMPSSIAADHLRTYHSCGA